MEQVLLEHIKGCGPQLTKYLRDAHLWSTYDLVLRRPKRYDDFKVLDIKSASHNQVITVIGKLVAPVKIFNKGKLSIINTKIMVADTMIAVTVFNQPFLANLKIDDRVLVKGKYNIFTHVMLATKMTKNLDQAPIKPVYDIPNVTDYAVSKIVKEIFDNQLVTLYETLPNDITSEKKLLHRAKAYQNIHKPKDEQDLIEAMYRFKYEEALLQQLSFVHKLKSRPNRPIKAYDLVRVKEAITHIPYQLTQDQKNAVNDIFKDFKQDKVSYRLIQGDVGSGKTIVANIAIYGVVTAGFQAVLMAPTEALAKQHYQSFKTLFPYIKCALLTSNTKDKKHIKEQLKEQDIEFIIGTQALLAEDVNFKQLGLTIIDEQHKFGVSTRNELSDKSKQTDIIYLTATPIPRSMAMAYYGHLTYSIIKEKPSYQKPVITTLQSTTNINQVLKQIKHNSQKKEQTYVVVPAIYEKNLAYSIESVYELLKDHIASEHLYQLHSKLKPQEQETMMQDFLNDTQGVLLATTMIEVGIDCKNATLMVILGAEYFGLSQLHQLRGRVGRGSLQSYCVMVSEKTDIERLNMMTNTTDGFELSQVDLKLRGPGDLLGDEQSGFIKYEFIDLASDDLLIKQAAHDALKYYQQLDKYPYLYKKISTM